MLSHILFTYSVLYRPKILNKLNLLEITIHVKISLETYSCKSNKTDQKKLNKKHKVGIEIKK